MYREIEEALNWVPMMLRYNSLEQQYIWSLLFFKTVGHPRWNHLIHTSRQNCFPFDDPPRDDITVMFERFLLPLFEGFRPLIGSYDAQSP